MQFVFSKSILLVVLPNVLHCIQHMDTPATCKFIALRPQIVGNGVGTIAVFVFDESSSPEWFILCEVVVFRDGNYHVGIVTSSATVVACFRIADTITLSSVRGPTQSMLGNIHSSFLQMTYSFFHTFHNFLFALHGLRKLMMHTLYNMLFTLLHMRQFILQRISEMVVHIFLLLHFPRLFLPLTVVFMVPHITSIHCPITPTIIQLIIQRIIHVMMRIVIRITRCQCSP
mmetsp:Transcript_5959/g.13236  ORF Transcript_5959/g.13236 Transcript_5959/m.13236 type:complete len:229 (-) Transcript_5959:455-1141(-)